MKNLKEKKRRRNVTCPVTEQISCSKRLHEELTFDEELSRDMEALEQMYEEIGVVEWRWLDFHNMPFSKAKGGDNTLWHASGREVRFEGEDLFYIEYENPNGTDNVGDPDNYAY